MDAQKIEKFIDAGYTKAEIELLFKDPKVDPEPDNKTEPEKDPESDNKTEPAEKETSGEDFAEVIATLAGSIAELKDTVKAMQQSNIDKARTGSNKNDTIEDAMQSFIEKL